MDSTVKTNADFQYKAGLRPKIRRMTDGKCCEWCSRLAGVYDYPDVPKDVFRRHANCGCVVEYDPGDGKQTENVHGGRRLTQKERLSLDTRAKEQEAKQKSEAARKREERIQNERRLEEKEKAEKFKRTFQAVPQDRVVAAMRQDAAAWINSLSDSERASLIKYTGNDDKVPKFYQRLNAMLRGAEPEDPSLRRHADIISGALKRSVLGENVICYRGLDVNPLAGADIGTVVNLGQFTSTSVIETRSFSANVKFVIFAPQGIKGAAFLEEISKFKNQREVLFDKDCWYRVLSNQENLVELEVL